MLSPTDPFDRALADLVAPPSWQNPRVTGRYDLVVLGGGTAGLVAAIGAAVVGAKVALVEKEMLGGDCLIFGCVPSKALLHAARVAHAARTSGELGIEGEASQVRFEVVMRHLRETRVKIAPHDAARTLEEHGVDVFFGEGKLSARDAVEVATQRLSFAKAVLATGTTPTIPKIDGLADVEFFTNETIFGLTTLPAHLVVLGGGPVGCELGQAFRRLGSEVTIVGRDPRLLPKDEEDASLALLSAFEHEGIRLVLGATVTRVRAKGERKVLITSDGLEIEGDVLLVAVGRTPSTKSLGLEDAGIDVDEHGIVVDDHLRTTNPDVYAAGDVASEQKLTHVAEAMARAALKNALFFGRSRRSEL
ncbi:MAG: FAD-dependent oxidoreductase, partial [Polyangiaceae bacterium]